MQQKYLVKRGAVLIGILLLALLVSGCVVRTYSETKPREDQNLAGNRGFIQGNIPASTQASDAQRKQTRTVHVTEIELRPPLRFERMSAVKEGAKTQDKAMRGNQGYLEEAGEPSGTGEVISYTVQKGDTLQKISMKIYGTTKKWPKIFQDNKDKLKSPEKIYVGQVLKIVK